MKNFIMPLITPFMNSGVTMLANSFTQRDSQGYQQDIFFKLLRQGAVTRFGKEHNFSSLLGLPYHKAYERYRRTIPIRTYADFWEEYFSPHFKADGVVKQLDLENITWPGRIRLFCETSGTTAPTKFIPFSREMFQANKQAAFDMIVNYLARKPSSRFLRGRLLYMSGSTTLNPLGEGILSGDMSAITLHFAPTILRPFIAPSPEISALPWEQKLEKMAQLLLTDRSITGISGVPPWILLLLQRCQSLGRQPVRDLLPNLELIIHGGTSMKPYKREFDELFPMAAPNYLELLPSSEGFVGFQIPGEDDMRFTPYYGVFFEFIPLHCLNDQGKPAPDATALSLEEVQLNERYAVIMSTCSGLWRYHIGDTIRFTSFSPLSFEFTGRDRFLDRFEEKVTQGEVEQAIAELNRQEGIEVAEFIVGPDIAARQHLWVLAMKRPGQNPEQLAALLDNSLIRQNADYAAFRCQKRINLPRVIIVDEDMIYRWSRDIRGKLGGQSKIPHIDPTLDGSQVQSLAEFAAHQRGAISTHPQLLNKINHTMKAHQESDAYRPPPERCSLLQDKKERRRI